MRVLHLIPTLGGGGAERQIVALAQGLRTLGVDVHVGIVSEGANLTRLEAAGAIVHRIAARGNYDPMLPLRIARLIRRVHPDVVQTWLTQMDVVGGLAALMTRTPWIISERTNKVYYPRDLKHGFRHFIGRFASAIVANSRGGAEYWSAMPSKKVVVVPNALPLADIELAVRDERDLGASEVILFAGRFDPAKNLPNLIDALSNVIRERDAVALLCGEGPLEGEVRARIGSAEMSDRIRLLGFTDQVFGLMKRADVFVSSSWFEGQPNAVLEAAACGGPLVLSDIPAHRECFGNDAALYADPSDPAAIAGAIRQTLDDRNAARQRAERARSIARQWSIERAASSYLQTYKMVTA